MRGIHAMPVGKTRHDSVVINGAFASELPRIYTLGGSASAIGNHAFLPCAFQHMYEIYGDSSGASGSANRIDL
jgi:hypothetical protein